MLRIGINGVGRIGRGIFRVNQMKNAFKVVAINDINPDTNNIAYTLNYDTLYGRLEMPLKVDKNLMYDNHNNSIEVYHEHSITDVDWAKHDVDYVIDSSGVLSNVVASKKLVKDGIVKRVFVTHSPDEVDFTMVLGANEDKLNLKQHKVISTSICDATALAPVLKTINDNFNIQTGYITTLHPWLNYQNLMDGPSSSWSVPGEIYHHFALGRSAIGNVIPKPTSAVSATCRVLEGVTEETMGSFSYRTPAAIVGSADISVNVEKASTRREIIDIFEAIENNQKIDIIHNNIEPLVSLDFLKSEFSAVVDHRWTDVIGGSLIKLVLWYDNEYGYSSRVVDQIKFIAAHEEDL